MSVSSFLFNGTPPASTTTYGETTGTIPTWFQDYQKGILAKANAVAAQPYQTYGAPRVAGFTGDQQAAFQGTRGMQGQYTGAANQAMNGAFAASNPNAATDAANPWLQKSGQASYQTVGNYMNPYNDAVTNRIAQLGARNLQENLMPAINQDFVRAGQYGSRNMMGEVGKALRDTQESVIAQQGQLLQSGYNNAMTAAQADANRFGDVGQAYGNFALSGQQQQLDANRVGGALATTAQDMGYKDLNALESVGRSQQQLNQDNLTMGYQDFQNQRDYPLQQLNVLQSALQGMQIPQSFSKSDTGPASVYSASPLSSAVGAGMSAWNLMNQ